MREGEGERRHLEADLELGRAHMEEILNEILPLVNHDQSKNELYHEMEKDLTNIKKGLELKRIYRETRRRLEDLDIGGTGGSRPEDRQEIHKLLIKLDQIPIELFDE
jgi:hypothetical protein